MRSSLDTPVQFRANSAVVAAAQEIARREGKSFAELLRDALHRQVSERA